MPKRLLPQLRFNLVSSAMLLVPLFAWTETHQTTSLAASKRFGLRYDPYGLSESLSQAQYYFKFGTFAALVDKGLLKSHPLVPETYYLPSEVYWKLSLSSPQLSDQERVIQLQQVPRLTQQEAALTAAYEQMLLPSHANESLQEFLARKTAVYVISKISAGPGEENIQYPFCCTCAGYLHYAVCKHSLAVALKLDPDGISSRFHSSWVCTPVGVRSKPGRPKKVPPALVHQ